jgi:2,4-dienoyl-CoA reductase-like NADH-dependent reductase (Old Yellow Enzyme family)
LSVLFQETRIGNLALKNRFVRSATWEGMAESDGRVSSQLLELMGELAAGGVGLMITGHAYVSKEGQAGPRQMGIYSQELVPGLAQMVQAVHERGGKIAVQLAHAGILAAYKLSGMEPMGPSAPNTEGAPGREMSPQEIGQVVEAFGRAAAWAVEAGFDAVQIHAAHGYLLSQFLSPYFNRRQDRYGGSVENRARALLEVVSRAREAIGPERALLVKMNSQDFLEGGLSLEDSAQVAQMLARAGVDAIEVSGGMRLAGPKFMPSRLAIKEERQEAYFKDAARAIRKRAGIPVILVGGIRSFQVAERLVEEEVADYISMSRPFIREPWLINRWKAGDLRRAFCVSDNQCFGPAQAGQGIYCVVARREAAGD